MSKKLCRLVEVKKTGGRKRLPLFLMLFSSFYFSSFLVNAENENPAPMIQQQVGNNVTGTVTDSKGEPIIGASVRVVGSKAGTITDMDGVFKLKVPEGGKITISYVGYDAQTVTPKNGKVKVILAENTAMLKDVQVVAYGVQKKATVTGAISGVKGEELTKTPVASVTNVLAGQISGISSIQSTGEPGADAATLYVRGRGSFNGSSPLIQVDGVTRDGSVFNQLDPNEIESITVLKDASATAVFGVEGANGVILVTTKRGKEGKAKISFSTVESVLMPTSPIKMANSYEYATFYNQVNRGDGANPTFSDEIIQKFKDHSDPIRFPDTDWVSYVLKKATLQTQQNVNITGGTKTVRYFVSAGMYTQGGLFKQFDLPYDLTYQYQRFNYRANIDIDVTKSTLLSINLGGRVDNSHKPYTGQGSSGMMKSIVAATPFSSPGLVDGKLVQTTIDYDDLKLPFTGGTGFAYYGGGFMSTSTNNLSADLALKQKLDFITKGLSFNVKGSYNSDFNVYKYASASVATYTPVLQSDGTIKYKKAGENTQLKYDKEGTGKGRNWYAEASLNYARDFGLHHVTALLMYNQRKIYYPSEYSDIPRGLVGMVGRVTYDWNNRYMIEYNMGYNGSENFAPEKRFGFFPAGSAGWTVSEEKFWKPLKSVVSYFKLRASFGLVGNDYVAKRFMYMADPYVVNNSTDVNRSGYGYNFGINNTSLVSKGAYESSKNNADVTWEKAFKQDYGVDAKFFNDRLNVSFDYYKETRNDLLVSDATAPSILGFSLPQANLGKMKSWGWELSLGWNDKIGKDFRYWLNLNLSYNQNEVIERKETPQIYEYQYQKGRRLGARSLYQFWKYYYEGCEADYEKEFGQPFPTQLQTVQPGDPVYVDLNGDGKIDNTDMSRDVGKYTDDPEYTFGLNMGFSWKNWDVTMQWTGAWHVSRLISGVFVEAFKSAQGYEGGLLKYIYDNAWTPENPSQDAIYPRPTFTNTSQNYASSSLYEKNSSYVRLKSLNIAYNFNFPFMRKIKLNQLQLGFSGYNLFTITKYIWSDPEGTASSSPNYPLTRSFALSLKVGF